MKQLGGAGAILAIVIALLAAACGGTSNAANEDSGGGKLDARRLLDAAGGLRGRSSRPSRRPSEGKGVDFSSPSAPPATRAARSRPACRPTSSHFSLEPRHDPAGRRRARRRRLEPERSTRASSPTRSSCFVVRKGNPKDIKTWDDLLEAGRRGRHPEPVHLGRRALEHHGRLRRPDQAGQVAEAGARLPEGALRATSPSRTRAPATRCRRSPRARATCCSLRERGDHRPAEGRGRRLRHPDQTILIENPVAVTTDAPQPARRRRSSTSSTPTRPEDLGRERLPPGRPEVVAEAVRLQDPDATLFTIERLRRLGQGQRRVLRSGRTGSVAKIEK